MVLFATEEKPPMRRIELRFGKGVAKYGLINDDDGIPAGLSGENDSPSLPELPAHCPCIMRPRFSAVRAGMKNIPYRAGLEKLVVTHEYREQVRGCLLRTGFGPDSDEAHTEGTGRAGFRKRVATVRGLVTNVPKGLLPLK